MLQLLISVLLSFGFSFDENGKLIGSATATKEQAYEQVRINAEFDNLGGDGALSSVIIIDNIDPKN